MANVHGFELLYMRDVYVDDVLMGVEGKLFLGDALCGTVRITDDGFARSLTFSEKTASFEFDFPPTALFELECAISEQLGQRPDDVHTIEELCGVLAMATIMERHARGQWLSSEERPPEMPTESMPWPVVSCPAIADLRAREVQASGLRPPTPDAYELKLALGLMDRRKMDAVAYILEDALGVDLTTDQGNIVLADMLLFEMGTVRGADGRMCTVAEALADARPEFGPWADSRHSRFVPTGPFAGDTAELFDVNTGQIVKVGRWFTSHENWQTGSVGCRMLELADGTCEAVPGFVVHSDGDLVLRGRPVLIVDDIAEVFSDSVEVEVTREGLGRDGRRDER